MPVLENAPPQEPPTLDYHGGGGGDGDDTRWAVVATFSHPMEAHLARIRLESEDVDCFLEDEYMIATDWLYSNAIGGVKLLVPEPDLPRARALLRRPSQPVVVPIDGSTCPSCGSPDIHPQRFARRWVFLSILLLGAPVPFLSRKYRCAACASEFVPRRGFEVIHPKSDAAEGQ